jgi:D-alanyl-D-alanine carboxypeptidase
MAEGYTKNGVKQDDKAKWQNNFSTRPARGSSAGGGYSTIEDMLKFSLALQTGKIHKPNLENQSGFMGLGIAGGAPGINAAFEVKPQTGYTIVVMSNYDPPSAEKVSKQLRNLLNRLKN